MKEMLSLSTERFISVWQFANQHGVKLWECCIKSFVLKQDNLFQIYAKRWNDLSILLKSIDQFRYTKTIHLGTRLRAITTELMWFIPMSLACINLGRILIYRNRSIHTKKKKPWPGLDLKFGGILFDGNSKIRRLNCLQHSATTNLV